MKDVVLVHARETLFALRQEHKLPKGEGRGGWVGLGTAEKVDRFRILLSIKS